MEYRCLIKILNITYKDRITNIEVRNRIFLAIGRGAATGTGWICPPTLKSRGTSCVLVPPTLLSQHLF